jgi:tape measure domain-containing protein
LVRHWRVAATLARIGDVSAGVQAPVNELAELYGKARVQGRLFAEDINQPTGRGIPIIGELAKPFGVSDSEVKKLIESGQVSFPAIEQAFIDSNSS